ncbi:MAG: restriction endonuclease subunit S [Bacilli bacterium]|nr:restriction endonuclease subunit S [Bacilli bacterium]
MMINVNEFKKKLITQALQGKLTEQLISDGTALELINEIVKTKSTLKKKWSILEVDNDNLPFAIPSSWTWCYLKSISDSIGGKTNQIQANEVKEKGEIPVVSQGKKYIDGYTSFSSKVITDIPVILFGDHTKIVKYINFEFVVGADGTKLLKPICVDNKFFYYLITYASFTIFDLGYSRHYSLLKKCPLPLPPLEEQKRIVAKLDEIFAELDKIDEQQTRLTTIQEKMETKILKLAIQGKLVEQRPEEGTGEELFKLIQKEKQELIKEGKIKKEKPLPVIEEDEIPFEIPSTWKWVRLKSICDSIYAGGDKPQDFVENKDSNHTIPVVANGVTNNGIIGYTSLLRSRENSITVAGRGTIGFTVYRNYSFFPIVRLIVLEQNKFINPIFLSTYFKVMQEKSTGTSIPQLTVPMIIDRVIPLPPLEEQNRIVAKIKNLLPLCRSN